MLKTFRAAVSATWTQARPPAQTPFIFEILCRPAKLRKLDSGKALSSAQSTAADPGGLSLSRGVLWHLSPLTLGLQAYPPHLEGPAEVLQG